MKRRKGSSAVDTLVELGFGPERKCPTMTQLAEATGIKPQTIWTWLVGDRWPLLDNAMLLATAMNVPLGTLATAIKNAHGRRQKAEEVQELLRQ